MLNGVYFYNFLQNIEKRCIMKNSKIKLICITGVLTALVFVVTAYLHIPTNNGYVHVGDGLIYLAACLLPWPYAMAVGAGGALLAVSAVFFIVGLIFIIKGGDWFVDSASWLHYRFCNMGSRFGYNQGAYRIVLFMQRE